MLLQRMVVHAPLSSADTNPSHSGLATLQQVCRAPLLHPLHAPCTSVSGPQARSTQHAGAALHMAAHATSHPPAHAAEAAGEGSRYLCGGVAIVELLGCLVPQGLPSGRQAGRQRIQIRLLGVGYRCRLLWRGCLLGRCRDGSAGFAACALHPVSPVPCQRLQCSAPHISLCHLFHQYTRQSTHS